MTKTLEAPQLWLGDCLELMADIPSGSVDMVMCDLPYGTTQNAWDSVLPLDRLWVHYWRVCRGAVVLTAAQPFTSILICSEHKFKYCWVWDKLNRPTGHLNAKKQPLRETEDIIIFYAAQCVYNPQMVVGKPYRATSGHRTKNYGTQVTTTTICDDGMRYPRNVIRNIQADNRGAEGRVHPTQKPVALMDYLIRTYTNPGDVVLDNCMGSGTTGVAALDAGRGFIGIEKDPGYFAIAERRIRGCDGYKALWET